VVVTIGNEPHPWIATALHFEFASAAFVPIPAPGGGVPTPFVDTCTPLPSVCACADGIAATASATVSIESATSFGRATVPPYLSLSPQTLMPKMRAALPRTIWSISPSGTPANCLSTHSCEYGNEPSLWG